MVLQRLRGLTFPLLSPETTFKDGQIREAALWALGKDKLTLDRLRIAGAEKLLFFKHEERGTGPALARRFEALTSST